MFSGMQDFDFAQIKRNLPKSNQFHLKMFPAPTALPNRNALI